MGEWNLCMSRCKGTGSTLIKRGVEEVILYTELSGKAIRLSFLTVVQTA